MSFPAGIPAAVLAYKAPLFVSGRDFVMANQLFMDEADNNTIYIVAFSVDHKTRPPVKGIVRGTIHMGGWIIKELPNGNTHAVFVQKSDLGGSLPKALLGSVMSKQGHRPHLLEKVMDKYKKRLYELVEAANY